MRNIPRHLQRIFDAFKDLPGHNPKRLFLDAVTTMALETMRASGLSEISGQPDRLTPWHDSLEKTYAGSLDGNARIVEAIAETILENRCADILGQVYDRLEIGNVGKGQFLTPGKVTQSMANMAKTDSYIRLLETQPVAVVCDPTCGSGAFLLSAAKAAIDAGYDPADRFMLEGMDIDETMARMCYIQLAYNRLTGSVRYTGGGALYLTPLYLGIYRAAREGCQ